MNKIGKIVAVGTLALVTLGGCNWGGDAKADAKDVDCNVKPSPCFSLTRASIIRQPDGFRNLSFGCWGTTGIYVTSRGIYEVGGQNSTPLPSDTEIVPDDIHCK